MQKIIVLGADGTLGSAFKHHSKRQWPANWRFYNKTECDITDANVLARILRANEPDVVINCAACNDVDATHQTQELYDVNVTGPQILALQCKHMNARLVHYSTNYVYGEGERFNENSPLKPWNAYAATKLAGEEPILDMGGLILRTSWIFGYPGARDLVRHIGLNQPAEVRGDTVSNPTFAGNLVTWTKQLLDRGRAGVYNACSDSAVSRFYFAQEIARALSQIYRMSFPLAKGENVSPRPKVCSMDNAKLKMALGLQDTSFSFYRHIPIAVTGTTCDWERTEPVKAEIHSDHRGKSCELFRFPGCAMGFASWSHPGVTRGPHEHVNQNEHFAVGTGVFEVYLWPMGSKTSAAWYRLNPGDSVFVPAGTVHAYRNVSDADALALIFPDQLWRGPEKQLPEDVIKWENRLDSPYELPVFSLR